MTYKIVLPEYVGMYLEEAKSKGYTLVGAFNFRPDELKQWFVDSYNQDAFARAWLNPEIVEVKKEKRYVVEIPNPNSISLKKTYLGKIQETGKIQLRDLKNLVNYASSQNQKLRKTLLGLGSLLRR